MSLTVAVPEVEEFANAAEYPLNNGITAFLLLKKDLNLLVVENHVEVYVGFLRKKLHAIGSNIRIEAIRRLGYHLGVDQDC